MKGAFSIMNASGHSAICWDTDAPTRNRDPENGPLDPEFVKSEFDRLLSEGHLAFTKTGGENVMLQRGEFDPEVHEEVTFARNWSGG